MSKKFIAGILAIQFVMILLLACSFIYVVVSTNQQRANQPNIPTTNDSKKSVEDEDHTKTYQVTKVPTPTPISTTAEKRVFKSDTLKLSFNYPAEFGDIKISDAESYMSCSDEIKPGILKFTKWDISIMINTCGKGGMFENLKSLVSTKTKTGQDYEVFYIQTNSDIAIFWGSKPNQQPAYPFIDFQGNIKASELEKTKVYIKEIIESLEIR